MENEENQSEFQSQPTAEQLISPKQTLEKRKKDIKEKFISWIKVRNNFILAIIFISIILLRFYYFWLTKNQPVWWDESEYLSAAKSFAGIVDYQLAEIRLPGLPLLISLFYIIGVNQEPLIKFFIIFIPSILVIFVFYFLIKEMYPDKRIAIISTIILSVLWESLFYSNRFQTENLSLLFEFIAIFLLFKVYMKKEKLWIITPKFSLIWILIFSGLSFFIRTGSAPFFPTIVFFLILLNQSFFTSKKYKKFSYPLLILILIISIFVIFNLESIPIISLAYHPEFALGWASLNIFKGYFSSIKPNIPSVFLYAFYLGLALVVINTFLIIDKIKKIYRDDSNLNFKSDLFNLILLFSVLFAFIFLIRPYAIEFRWFFMILPPILVFTSKGIIIFSEFIESFIKNNKVAIILILIILSLGVYDQVIHADLIIKTKLDSYQQIRDAGLWIKQNSNTNDIVLSRSPHQITYYSERKTYNYGQFNKTQFFELVKKVNPKYMLESVLEPHPGQWGYEPTPEMKKIITPVKAWYAEDGQTPIAVLYAFHQTQPNNLPLDNLLQDNPLNNTPPDNPSNNTSSNNTPLNNTGT